MPNCIFTNSETATRAAVTVREKGLHVGIEVWTPSNSAENRNLFALKIDSEHRDAVQKLFARHRAGPSTSETVATAAVHCPDCESIWVTSSSAKDSTSLAEKIRWWLSPSLCVIRPPHGPRLRCANCGSQWTLLDESHPDDTETS